jgi:hypothetical protein
MTHLILTNVHPPRLQILSRFQNLFLQLRICVRNIVECKHAPTELEEQVCAEGNQGPEWNLVKHRQREVGLGRSLTYIWNNLLLNLLRECDDLHEYGEIYLQSTC